MEIIGLVVIVILLTMGMLFMAMFALNEEPGTKVFTRKGLASSTMAALMKTTVHECGSYSLPQIEKHLIEDCAVNKGSLYYDYSCGGKNSCDYLEEKIPQLLNDTLGKWNKRYEFQTLLISSNQYILYVNSSRGNCQRRERDTSGEYFLPTGKGLVKSVLYICD